MRFKNEIIILITHYIYRTFFFLQWEKNNNLVNQMTFHEIFKPHFHLVRKNTSIWPLKFSSLAVMKPMKYSKSYLSKQYENEIENTVHMLTVVKTIHTFRSGN